VGGNFRKSPKLVIFENSPKINLTIDHEFYYPNTCRPSMSIRGRKHDVISSSGSPDIRDQVDPLSKIQKIAKIWGLTPGSQFFLLEVGTPKGYKPTKFQTPSCSRLAPKNPQNFNFGPLYLGNHVIDLVLVLFLHKNISF